MKKIIKNPIFTFIVGIVLATSVTTVALSVVASDVAYDNTNSGSTATTMQGAIDDLYDKAANSGGEIVTVTLGTATSYNIKELYPDIWDQLTTDNFYYKINGASATAISGCEDSSDRSYASLSSPSISYDTSTGVLTCGNGSVTAQCWWGSSKYIRDSRSSSATTTCYMVYAE